jgi:hypothetical protein
MRLLFIVPAFLLLSNLPGHAQSAKASADGLASFKPLIGIWKGEWQYSQPGEQHSQQLAPVVMCIGPTDSTGGRKGDPRFGWLAYEVSSSEPGRVPGKITVQVKEMLINGSDMNIDISSQIFDRRLLVKTVNDTDIDATVWVKHLKGRNSEKPSTGDAHFSKVGPLADGQTCPSAANLQ